MTTFGDGVYQYGGVPIGGGMLPSMGTKSKAFFIHGSEGLAANSGTSPDQPLKTLTQAYAKMTDGAGDVAYILNDGSSGATVRDVALVWAKDNCHIIGLGAPAINNRARISTVSGSTDVDAYTPYLTLSASGCIVSNVSWFQGNSEDAKASVGILLSGERNYLSRLSIITGVHANQGDENTVNLQVTGSENVIEDCYIGQDTAAVGFNSKVWANVRFGSGAADEATRNVFRRCIFPMFANDTEPFFIYAPSTSDTQRWNLFESCSFLNTGTSTLAGGVSWAADVGGYLFLDNCGFYGCTDVTAADNALVLQVGPLNSATPVDRGLYTGTDTA
jgi:hypothetical protein